MPILKSPTRPTFQVGDTFEATIDSLSFNGGRGVGRVQGMVVFVPWSAPLDHIRGRVTAVKSNFLEGEIVQILKPSPYRRDPPCPVFGRCGGCTWQHIEIQEQLAQKQWILKNALQGLQQGAELPLLPILPGSREYNYRNRIQVTKKRGVVGFFARGSHLLVASDHCLIAEREVSDRIKDLEAHPDGRYEISRRTSGEVDIDVGERSPQTALFAQVNSEQNQLLMDQVLAAAHDQTPTRIWDLYCGSGNLTLPLAEAFPTAELRGVELSYQAVTSARKAAPHIKFEAKDVAAFLKEQTPAPNTLVVLDPPRMGLTPAVGQQLLRLKPERIVYVSCDPMTFTRDVRPWLHDYRLIKIQPLDMFPQTEHIELVACLQAI